MSYVFDSWCTMAGYSTALNFTSAVSEFDDVSVSKLEHLSKVTIPWIPLVVKANRE